MLRSPFEDFSGTTLKAVPGMIGKLQYVAGLRQGNGNYFHWGLARQHGEDAANETIAESHAELFRAVLETPLPSLWEELCLRAADENDEVTRVVEELVKQKDGLTPSDLRGVTKRHFNSVLIALSSLATSPEAKRTDRDA